MKKFFRLVAFNPVAQTIALFALIAIPVEEMLYIAALFVWLVLFCTSFLRQGAKRKILWLCSFLVITAISVLLIAQFAAYGEGFITVAAGGGLLQRSTGNSLLITGHHMRYAAIVLLFGVQCCISRREKELRAKTLTVAGDGAERTAKWYVFAALRVLAGIAIGYVAFRVSAKICVYVDHSYDAIDGPYRYYGLPLPFYVHTQSSSPLTVFFSMKFQRIAFNLLAWCCAAWAFLFSPEIGAAIVRNGKRLVWPVVAVVLAIAAISVLVYLYSDQIGYHWYWGDIKFWEYERYRRPPEFPWWQWLLIYL